MGDIAFARLSCKPVICIDAYERVETGGEGRVAEAEVESGGDRGWRSPTLHGQARTPPPRYPG